MLLINYRALFLWHIGAIKEHNMCQVYWMGYFTQRNYEWVLSVLYAMRKQKLLSEKGTSTNPSSIISETSFMFRLGPYVVWHLCKHATRQCKHALMASKQV